MYMFEGKFVYEINPAFRSSVLEKCRYSEFSLFYMKITASVTKSSHQDCGRTIYTYRFFPFTHTPLF